MKPQHTISARTARTPAERAAYIQALVDVAPEFSTSQLDSLQLLLRPVLTEARRPIAA